MPYQLRNHLPSDHTKSISPENIKRIQERYLQLTSVNLGIPDVPLSVDEASELGVEVSFLQMLLIGEYGKGTSRAFIEALMTPILCKNFTQLQQEEKLYVEGLPNSVADYVMYQYSWPIGIVAAKTGGTLKADSVIQCMLQLLALRTKAPQTLFGVVSDGFRFVFLLLTKDGRFLFEQDQSGCQDGYYDINTWEDLHTVVSIFNGLLQWEIRFVSVLV